MALNSRGVTLMDAGKYEEAVADFSNAIGEVPEDCTVNLYNRYE